MPSYPNPKLELKYCERCGGLWLRPLGSEVVYCAACAEDIRQLPPARGGTPSGAVQAAYAGLLAMCALLSGFTECMGGAVL